MSIQYTESRTTVVLDTECFPTYWAIGFRCVETGRVRCFERTANQELDFAGIVTIMRGCRVLSFNGLGYDMPMIALAMSGATNSQLKQASDDIILGDLRNYQFYDKYGVKLPPFIDHVDMMEVSPGSPSKPSLKLYAGRLHSRRMQDLPYDPDRQLTPSEQRAVGEYLINDLDVTVDMYCELKVQIALRALMSQQFGVDVRSKSDAQVAEAVIKAEIERISGRRVYKPEVRSGVFQYRPPAWISFESLEMRAMLDRIVNAKFAVGHDGVVRMPEVLKDAAVVFGDSVYRMGIGGLHSSESSITHYSDDDYVLLDRDVTSYYPNIILGTGLYPPHLGQVFLKVYGLIYEQRLAAKRVKDKNTSETLKIVLNGSFGKFGSPFSVLYAPDLMIQTTVGGQLAILMLIERLHMRGFNVVSANTDGFVTKVERSRVDEFRAVAWDWECDTGLMTEETEYIALHSRDVNNYIALYREGDEIKAKSKGAFAPAGPGQPAAAGMKKNPDCEVSINAAVEYLKHGTPIEDTIDACDDFRQFICVQRVNGGAEKDGEYIGKAIRWYYAEGERGYIQRMQNGNTVPRSLGARPCMELPDELPDDIDYAWYVREAHAILEDVGYPVDDPNLEGRSGTMLARLPDQKNFHVVSLPDGVALCGKRRKSMRDSWVESSTLPAGHRLCSKCRKETEL